MSLWGVGCKWQWIRDGGGGDGGLTAGAEHEDVDCGWVWTDHVGLLVKSGLDLGCDFFGAFH